MTGKLNAVALSYEYLKFSEERKTRSQNFKCYSICWKMSVVQTKYSFLKRISQQFANNSFSANAQNVQSHCVFLCSLQSEIE